MQPQQKNNNLVTAMHEEGVRKIARKISGFSRKIARIGTWVNSVERYQKMMLVNNEQQYGATVAFDHCFEI